MHVYYSHIYVHTPQKSCSSYGDGITVQSIRTSIIIEKGYKSEAKTIAQGSPPMGSFMIDG